MGKFCNKCGFAYVNGCATHSKQQQDYVKPQNVSDPLPAEENTQEQETPKKKSLIKRIFKK